MAVATDSMKPARGFAGCHTESTRPLPEQKGANRLKESKAIQIWSGLELIASECLGGDGP